MQDGRRAGRSWMVGNGWIMGKNWMVLGGRQSGVEWRVRARQMAGKMVVCGQALDGGWDLNGRHKLGSEQE